MSRRGVWQLSKLTLNYCEHSGSSRGVREFVAGGLDAFRQANPQLELVAALRPGRHPHAAADYGAFWSRAIGFSLTALQQTSTSAPSTSRTSRRRRWPGI